MRERQILSARPGGTGGVGGGEGEEGGGLGEMELRLDNHCTSEWFADWRKRGSEGREARTDEVSRVHREPRVRVREYNCSFIRTRKSLRVLEHSTASSDTRRLEIKNIKTK